MHRDPIKTKCSDCGTDISVPYCTYMKNSKHHKPIRCKSCMSKYMSNISKRIWENKTDEERKEFANKKRDDWNNKSQEEKERITLLRSNGIKEAWKNKSDKEREEISNHHKQRWTSISIEEYKLIQDKKSAKAKAHWENLSIEEKEKETQKLIDINKNWRDNMSDEEKQKFSDKAKLRWENKSDNDKEKESLRLKQIAEKYRSNMTDEDREKIRNKKIEYWVNLNKEEKQKWSDSSKMRWDNMGAEERSKFIRDRIVSSSGPNKLHKRFEETFNSSILIDKFKYTAEYPCTNNDVSHCWDYAIYDKNGLVAVVDLDGAYYHADICDYDGIHSKEEYDERRGLSAPIGTNIIIINELKFNESFSYMERILNMDYETSIINKFNEYRSQPFPYPSYTDIELCRSYDQLQRMNIHDEYHQSLFLNTRLGDRIIYHFHHTIWHEKIKDKLSPYDAFNTNKVLMDLIRNHNLYHINKNKILQGFNVCDIAQKTPFISPAKAKMIIGKYLSKYDMIFNPYNNYDEIMLGAISSNKRYVGYETNEIRLMESNRLLSFLKKFHIMFNAIITAEQSENFPCLCTSVTNDDCIDYCLSKYECEIYVFIVNNTTRYTDKIVEKISPNENIILIERRENETITAV